MRIDQMRLHHIRMIVMVADGASMAEAGRAVNLERAAVSLTVRRCEEMLGTPIFARKYGRIAGISEEGLELLTRFRAILAMVDGDAETVWTVAESARPQYVPTGLRVINRRAA